MSVTRSVRHTAFGAAIREVREEAGFSQEGLADEAGLHRTYVGGVERGERNPSLDILYRLADAVETPLSAIALRAEEIARVAKPRRAKSR